MSGLVGLDGQPVGTDIEARKTAALNQAGALMLECFGALLGWHPSPGKQWTNEAKLEQHRHNLALSILKLLGQDIVEKRWQRKIGLEAVDANGNPVKEHEA